VSEAKPPVEPKPPFFSGKLLLAVLGLIALFGSLLAAGLWPRREKAAAITKEAREEAAETPMVTVAKAAIAPPIREVLLPGTVSALLDTPVYARAEGYLRAVKADIGDVVKKGQVLVELDTPELDQQLRAAKARLDQLRASLAQSKAAELKSAADVKLATVTRDRVAKLVEQGVFSKQQGDDSAAQLEVREAELIAARATIQAAEQTVHAQEAEVQRIEELSAFKLVRAPFDGIITVRNCATGNLVTPSAANGGRELYRMANYDVLRVFVAVPQANLLDVATGQAAEVLANEIGSRKFTGKVVRSASALDETTRTERTEVRVENRDHALLPGMYVQVRFLSPKPRTMVVIPGDTLLTPASGPQVAVVGEGNKVRFQKVEVGRDLGTQVEVINGLAGGESLIVNPSDAVRPGIRVRPVPRK